jgi:hypothetical protein
MINKIHGEPHINKIIGMTEKEAIDQLKKIDKTMRVVNRDGASIMVSGMNDNMNRVNVFVSNGVISNIDGLG